MMRALDLRSAASPEATEHPELDAELKLARVRAQVAVVRTLTDHIERFAHVADLEGLREQVVEEMARLECRLYEASMAKRGVQNRAGSSDAVWRPTTCPSFRLTVPSLC